MAEYRVVGIDPGLTGALALVTKTGIVSAKLPFVGGELDGDAVGRILREWQPDLIVLEQPFAKPPASMPRVLHMGINYGRLYERCLMHGARLLVVKPAEWSKGMGCPAKLDRKSIKAWRINRARELFPTLELTSGMDGHADAALMAWRYRNG